jgi:hypothetical protein
MKTRFSPVLWILIVAFASHGAVPGVVVCVEPTGQVQVEAITVNCCSGNTNLSGQTADPAFTTSAELAPGDSCGPCTDSPISPIPVIKPAANGDSNVDALASTTLAFDPAATRTEAHSANPTVAKDAALIPIKTTTLLI